MQQGCLFLTNMLDPRNPAVPIEKLKSTKDKDEQETRERLTRWLESKTIGEPAASPFYTVSQLEAEGFIGVFFCPGNVRRPVQDFNPDLVEQVDDVTLLLETLKEIEAMQEEMKKGGRRDN